jgi:hypothetical protein
MHPEAPTYSGLRIRAEFVQLPRSMFERDARPRRSGDCFGLHRQVGTGLLTRGIACSFQLAGWRPRGSREHGRRVVDAAASDRSRDVGAEWRFLEGGVPSHALFQVDNVPMANLLRGDRHSGTAEVLP